MRLALLAALAAGAFAAGALAAGRDDAMPPQSRSAGGPTTEATLADPDGDGRLSVGAGEALGDREALAPAAPLGRELARFSAVTDVHVRDEESPLRAAFLDRLGAPFESTFRPQEALAPHVLARTLEALRADRPQALLVLGDLIDNAQANELAQALAVLQGGTVRPGSGEPGYEGVQEASSADPFFYRPDVDAPRHPGLLARAQRPFPSPGAPAPWLPVTGNHDLLVAGELPAGPRLGGLATGDTAVRGVDVEAVIEQVDTDAPDPDTIEALLARGLPGGEEVPVAPDAGRRLLAPGEVVARLREASGVRGTGDRLDYTADLGERVRLIVLDTIDRREGEALRDGEAGGDAARPALEPVQRAFLTRELERAGDRWVVVAAHRRLGEDALGLLDAHDRVAAVLHGDTHDHAIDPRPGGGYWIVGTAALVDWPQQARTIRLLETRGGGVAVETWTVDHAGGPLAGVARELAHLDAQGGRPQGSAGRAADRNARLFVPAP